VSAQEQIGKLQGLLARIQRNASAPRGNVSTAVAAPPLAAPSYAGPPPAPSYAAPPASVSDQSVDELLGVSTEPSEAPPQVDVEVSLESLPPPPVEAASVPSEAPEAEPIPLVAASAPQPAPLTVDEAFALESEVSEVRITTGMREPAVEVTVAAIEAEAEAIGAEELSEDDLVEVTEGTPAPAAASDVDIDFDDEEQQPPASSQRKVATSMDEALAAAAEQLDQEREVPIKTPPPESGPQEAPPATGFAAPPAPDVDALLGGELDIPTREVAQAVAPTQEQLGQTIDLDEARGPSLELAEHPSDAPAPAPVEELEVALPGRDAGGGYDDNLQPPPEARDDLEAHRRRLEDDIPPPPESLATLPSVQPGPAPEIVPVEVAPVAPAPLEAAAPEIVARPVPAGSPQGFTSVREAFRPSSFSELLDASLSLNGY
jgi:hypothetical protein